MARHDRGHGPIDLVGRIGARYCAKAGGADSGKRADVDCSNMVTNLPSMTQMTQMTHPFANFF